MKYWTLEKLSGWLSQSISSFKLIFLHKLLYKSQVCMYICLCMYVSHNLFVYVYIIIYNFKQSVCIYTRKYNIHIHTCTQYLFFILAFSLFVLVSNCQRMCPHNVASVSSSACYQGRPKVTLVSEWISWHRIFQADCVPQRKRWFDFF